MSGTFNMKSLLFNNFFILSNLKKIFHNRFYLGKHNGRQLTLQPQLGSADLNAVFYGSRRPDNELLTSVSISANSLSSSTVRKHIIQVSTYQMCILLMFNTHEILTFEVNY